jgi:hypothetical protein
MAERNRGMTAELRAASFGTYGDMFAKYKQLASEYGTLSPEGMVNAFRNATGWGNLYTPNPYVQNNRIKGISTRPANYTKEQVAKMIEAPEGNEKNLRAVERALEFSAYPLFNIRTTYQNLLTYKSFVAPEYATAEEIREKDFLREWRICEKLRKTLNLRDRIHEIAGQVLQEGKVFYIVRMAADKPHNKIDHAFMQQLPSDYCKIVGFNNKTKYTVAFNLMYFANYGTDWRQFGDLFADVIGPFTEAVYPEPKGLGKTLVFGAKTTIDIERAKRDGADAYFQNGRWYYWVTLPADRVFTFEMDDTQRNVFSPFTGLMIDMIQLSQLEQIQLSLVQNPLVSILHGEIPYWSTKDTEKADQYKLSDAGVKLFTAMFNDMLVANNTSGIGLFMAPLENMHLSSLAEAPSAMDIVTKGYQDTISKTGLSGIIPAAGDTRAGAVQVSFYIHCQFLKEVYRGTERMMQVLFERLNLRFDWRFTMFGSLYEDEKTEERVMKGMEHGLLPDLLIYNALRDRSLLDDLTFSDAVLASGIMDKRLPLITSFSAKQQDGLPPRSEGGRPPVEDVTTDGQEGDVDA